MSFMLLDMKPLSPIEDRPERIYKGQANVNRRRLLLRVQKVREAVNQRDRRERGRYQRRRNRLPPRIHIEIEPGVDTHLAPLADHEAPAPVLEPMPDPALVRLRSDPAQRALGVLAARGLQEGVQGARDLHQGALGEKAGRQRHVQCDDCVVEVARWQAEARGAAPVQRREEARRDLRLVACGLLILESRTMGALEDVRRQRLEGRHPAAASHIGGTGLDRPHFVGGEAQNASGDGRLNESSGRRRRQRFN